MVNEEIEKDSKKQTRKNGDDQGIEIANGAVQKDGEMRTRFGAKAENENKNDKNCVRGRLRRTNARTDQKQPKQCE